MDEQYNLFAHRSLAPTLFDASIFVANMYDGYARVAGMPLPPVAHPHLLLSLGPLAASVGVSMVNGGVEGIIDAPVSSRPNDSMLALAGAAVRGGLTGAAGSGVLAGTLGVVYAGAGQLTGALLGYLTK